MGAGSVQSREIWALARRQHWTITYEQLRGLGCSEKAIRHRVRTGRLHDLPWRGVYAVGRRDLTQAGWWTAAVLACGEGACLSHESAGQHRGIRPRRRGLVHVSVPHGRNPRREGIKVHRRHLEPDEVTVHDGIPTTTPLVVLVDLAPGLDTEALERAIGQADILGLITPEELRSQLDETPRRPGVGRLKRALDRHTYVLTHTELERRFVAIVKRGGLPLPDGQKRMSGNRVDFHWPQLGLVVETDGLTYHRTAAQQAEDLVRDHVHAVAGLVTLRFSHAQVKYEPRYVEATLAAVARRVMI